MTRRDAVTPELRRQVLARDGRCFISRIDPSHACFDVFGIEHPPDALRRLTLDHVHDVAGGIKGRRAPSDLQHLTAMCWRSNVNGPSRIVRMAQREYLRGLYD